MRSHESGPASQRRLLLDLGVLWTIVSGNSLLARSHFNTSDDTTEAQHSHRDTETSRRALLCGSVDFCGSVVWTRVLK